MAGESEEDIMNKISRTLLSGFLAFVMVFASIVPMSAGHAYQEYVPEFTIEHTIEAQSSDPAPLLRCWETAKSIIICWETAIFDLIFETGSFYTAEDIYAMQNLFEAEGTNQSMTFGAFLLRDTLYMILPPTMSPPSSWWFNGFVNGGWHVGELSYVSSIRAPSSQVPGYFTWIVTYEGWAVMAGR